ncbi:hypothetical protein FD754_018636, partial [Muntiacus muntjak]
LYNEDRNLLRIREKERRNQEAHQDKEAFSEKIPLFGEPYKTEKGDELSSRIQNMLGNYEEMKEFLSSKSHPQRLDASENRLGKPRYPLFPEKGSSIPPHSLHTSVHHQPVNTPACGPLPAGNVGHHPKMAQPRMEPMPSLQVKSYGPLDSQHPTQERLGQEGYGSSLLKKGDRRAEGDHCALTTDSAPERELSPLFSLPSPVPPLSPVHSSQQPAPRTQGSGQVPGSSSRSKGCCLATSPKGPAVKVHDKEPPHDGTVPVGSLGVAPPQPPAQTFPPPSLPSKSLAMQQKPTAYVRPMDGQDQAPSESPELKPLPEEYRQQTFEKSDLKVPAKAKLTKLKMPSQSVESCLTYGDPVNCSPPSSSAHLLHWATGETPMISQSAYTHDNSSKTTYRLDLKISNFNKISLSLSDSFPPHELILEWVAISFSRGSSQPRDRTRSPTLQADSLPSEPPRKPQVRMRIPRPGIEPLSLALRAWSLNHWITREVLRKLLLERFGQMGKIGKGMTNHSKKSRKAASYVCVNISNILTYADKSLEPSKVYCQFKFASASTCSYGPTIPWIAGAWRATVHVLEAKSPRSGHQHGPHPLLSSPLGDRISTKRSAELVTPASLHTHFLYSSCIFFFFFPCVLSYFNRVQLFFLLAGSPTWEALFSLICFYCLEEAVTRYKSQSLPPTMTQKKKNSTSTPTKNLSMAAFTSASPGPLHTHTLRAFSSFLGCLSQFLSALSSWQPSSRIS